MIIVKQIGVVWNYTLEQKDPQVLNIAPCLSLIFHCFVFPQGGWATPRGSAILGQPVGPAKQASLRVPGFKN